jgi:hypothetical protein
LNKECTEAKLNIELQAGFSCFYSDVQKIGIMISSPSQDANLSGMQVIVKGKGKTESFDIRESLVGSNQKVTYLLSTNLNDLEEISVAPIVKVGSNEKRCGVTAKVSAPTFPKCPEGTTPVGVAVGGDCIDGIQNGDETGVDCGGRCITGTEILCSDGLDNDKDCLIDTPDPDCPDCADGVKNQDETDIDCGGTICPKCVDGKACLIGTDCQSNYCLGGICTTPTCSDGIQNGDETGIDCGGSCISGTETLCSDGLDNDKDCLIDAADSDCAPTCSDGIQNGDETGIDCGGSCITGTEILCSDGLDNDKDCLIDSADQNCIPTQITFIGCEDNTVEEAKWKDAASYAGSLLCKTSTEFTDANPRTGSYALGLTGDFDPNLDAWNRTINLAGYRSVSISMWESSEDTENEDNYTMWYWNGASWSFMWKNTLRNSGSQTAWTQHINSIPDAAATSSFAIRVEWETSSTLEHMILDDVNVTGII